MKTTEPNIYGRRCYHCRHLHSNLMEFCERCGERMENFDMKSVYSPEFERIKPLHSTLPDEPPVTLAQDIAQRLREYAGNAFNADTCRAGANEIERLRLARQAMETQWHRAEVELDNLRRELETVRRIAARAIARIR